MQPGSVSRQGLHHMSKGVAVIEDCAPASFSFIVGDNGSFGFRGKHKDVVQQGRIHSCGIGEV